MSEPVRPEVAAWGLASRKGWIDIDRELLMRLIWVPCPPFFPDGTDREEWAAESAALWWQGREHRDRQATDLATVLAAAHQDIYAAGHCHQAVIHLPDPAMVPLPVQFGIWAMQGDRDETLRMLAHVTDPDAIEAPLVEEFTTERLGTGLKSLHYRQGRDGRLDGYLNYAWRSEKYETDLRLFSFCWDLGRLQEAMPDIDELANAVEIVPRQQ